MLRTNMFVAVLILTVLVLGCQAQTATPTTAPTATKAPAAAAPTTAPAAASPTAAPAAPTATRAPAVKMGGTLRVASGYDTNGIDPAGRTLSLGGTGQAARMIYNGLVQYDPDTQKLLPELAREWTISPDGKEIVFKLQPNVKFHDGTPFNAAAVKAHFERMTGIADPKYAGRFKNNFLQLAEVQVVDDLTAKFILKKPQASFMSFLGDGSGFIPSPAAVQKFGEAISLNPVGTGPMKVKEWTKDTRFWIEKNPDYFEKDAQGNKYPYLDAIIFSPIPDAAVQIANVRTGTMDFADEIAPAEVSKVKADPNLVYYEKPSFGMETIYPMYDKAPFDNRACREAFFGAIDKAAISKAVYFDVSKPAETIISPASAYFDPNTKGIPFDLNRAKQKLVECGKPDGFDVKLHTMTLPRVQQRMEAVQAQVKKTGINLELVLLDITGVIAERTKANGMAIYEGSYSDPTHYVGTFQCDNAANWEKICEPDLEKLYNDAEAAFDFDKRKAIVQEIAKYAAHTPWMWPIVHNPINAISVKKVKGYRPGPQQTQHFKWIWLDG